MFKQTAILWGISFIGAISINLQSQDTLSLSDCYQILEQTYPLSKQIPLSSEINELKIRNLNKNYLPMINVNGQASYQSDVTQVVLDLPAGMPSISPPVISKDWYKATLDINQVLWDGNVTSYQKKLENYNLQVDQTNIKAEIYKLKERINLFFITIDLLKKTEDLYLESQEQIREKLKEVNAGIKYGTVLQSTSDALEAELIKLDQSIEETRIERRTNYQMLSELLSTGIPETTVLIFPGIEITDYKYTNLRLENLSFNMQRSRLDLMHNMVTTKWNPKFYAFGQGGIGRPGLNMLSNNFEPFYVVGAKLTWNPWNWNQNKNEKKVISLQSSMVEKQQETLDKTLRIQSGRDLGEIEKAKSLLEKDLQIIKLRERISKTSSVQLDNGVITSSEYINRLTEERQARLSYEIHQIQLIKAQLSFLFNQGKL